MAAQENPDSASLLARDLEMVIGPTQEKTVVAARGFVIWGEELSRKARYAAAERLYRRALTLVEGTLGAFHPITGEVLDCYADFLAKIGRQAEAIVMKDRAEAAWQAYSPRFRRTYKDTQQHSLCWQEREGSD
jgi:hypothetical protein